jgi:hypothetical protein
MLRLLRRAKRALVRTDCTPSGPVTNNSLRCSIPVTYGNVNHLQRKNLYRRFESSPLRHAVWTARISRPHFLQNPRIMPIFRSFSPRKRTTENGLLGSGTHSSSVFLWSSDEQSGLQSPQKANTRRSHPNVDLTFVCGRPALCPTDGRTVAHWRSGESMLSTVSYKRACWDTQGNCLCTALTLLVDLKLLSSR